jgi:hypothetical protein
MCVRGRIEKKSRRHVIVVINIVSMSNNNMYTCKLNVYRMLLWCKYHKTYIHPPLEIQTISTLKWPFLIQFVQLSGFVKVIGSFWHALSIEPMCEKSDSGRWDREIDLSPRFWSFESEPPVKPTVSIANHYEILR